MNKFQSHRGFARAFSENKLTIGLILPLESYTGSLPEMDLAGQMEIVKMVENLGFAALFVRDSPLYDPDFGDVGGLYEPHVYLSYIAARKTSRLERRVRLQH
ncbi:hypothetical protein [Oceanobacillus alkalisoli]|uniref:hypothetical protein n=1 Tax=Oceanobacillus alkalisoli TaxID=2925113 RepID=UPI001F11A60C|nr:hypothetical protein [Oceanobacillus alkalisoli]MCF3943196.1 hypothetical protein [Oceanobacillus alkalisoli]